MSLDEVPDPSPYDKSLSRVVIRSGSGKVVVTLMDDGQSLLINNDRDFHVETAVVAVLVQNDDGCPTSPNRMQRQVSRRQVPRGVERVDGANPGTDDAHPNIRFNDWRSALNQDGTWGHDDGSDANLTSKTIQWLQWGKYSTVSRVCGRSLCLTCPRS